MILKNRPKKIKLSPIMKTMKVGVKFPVVGTPLSVEGIDVLALPLAIVGVAEGAAVAEEVAVLLGVGVIFNVGVGAPEGVAVFADGEAVIAGRSLFPEAKTTKL